MSYASERVAQEGQPRFSIDDRDFLDRSRFASRYSGLRGAASLRRPPELDRIPRPGEKGVPCASAKHPC